MGLFSAFGFSGAEMLQGYQDQQIESHKQRVAEGMYERQQLGQRYLHHINDPTTPPDTKEELESMYSKVVAFPPDKKLPKELKDPTAAYSIVMKRKTMSKPPAMQSPAFAGSAGQNTVAGGNRWGLGDPGAPGTPPEEFSLGGMSGKQEFTLLPKSYNQRQNPDPIYTQRADKLTNPTGQPINMPSMQDYATDVLEPARNAYSQDMAGYTPGGRYTPTRAAQEQGGMKAAGELAYRDAILDDIRARYPNMKEEDLQRTALDMLPNVNPSNSYQRQYGLQKQMLSVIDESGNLMPMSAYWNPNQGQQGYYFADGPAKDQPIPEQYRVVNQGQMRLMPTGMQGNVMAVDSVGNPVADTGMTRPRLIPRIVMSPDTGSFSVADPGALPAYDPNSQESQQAVSAAMQNWAMNGVAPATPQLKIKATNLAMQQGIVILGDKERTMLKDMYTANTSVQLLRGQFVRLMSLQPESEEFAQAALELQNTVDALRASFSRGVFAERGVLTEGDVKRSGALLPGLTSAAAEAVAGVFPNYNLNNLDTLSTIIDNSQQGLFSVHSMYNTLGQKVAGIDYSATSTTPGPGPSKEKWMGDWKP